MKFNLTQILSVGALLTMPLQSNACDNTKKHVEVRVNHGFYDTVKRVDIEKDCCGNIVKKSVNVKKVPHAYSGPIRVIPIPFMPFAVPHHYPHVHKSISIQRSY